MNNKTINFGNNKTNFGDKKDLKIYLEEESSNNEGREGRNKRKTLLKRKKMIDWNDRCMHCGDYGDLLCCEDCPNVSHLECAGLSKVPDVWRCSDCLYKLSNRRMTRNSYNKGY